MSVRLIKYLLDESVLTPEQVALAQRHYKSQTSSAIIKNLAIAGLINEWELTNLLGNAFKLPVAKITSIDPEAVKLIPFESIQQLQCIPVRVEKNAVQVAFADPTRAEEMKSLRSSSNQPISLVLATFSNVEAAIDKVSTALKPPKPSLGPQSGPSPGQLNEASVSSLQQVKKFGARDQIPVVLNEIFSVAILKGASDIHLETQAKHIRVRCRIEGTLYEVFHVPLELREQLCSRIKVLAGLDIAERRLPQDGRIKIQVGKSEYDLRLNIMPAHLGESIALRVLRPETVQLNLSKMGFSERQLNALRKGIESPSGMVLVTGPTGCGKTTTLYSVLGELNHGREKIATVEDPVEYNLDGIIQVQVNNETGLGFPTILKALLRQDPDVLLVGEIRDQETAAIAIQAALSGHLVLSTLHTNDAPSAILRLLNMGIEPFMVLTSVSTVIAQRLVRKICNRCKEEVKVLDEELMLLGDDRHLVEGVKFLKGRGCSSCLGGGYRGRIAVFEVLELTEPLKELLLKGENPVSFKRKAVENGMTSLRQSALHLVASGITSLEEAVASTVEK